MLQSNTADAMRFDTGNPHPNESFPRAVSTNRSSPQRELPKGELDECEGGIDVAAGEVERRGDAERHRQAPAEVRLRQPTTTAGAGISKRWSAARCESSVLPCAEKEALATTAWGLRNFDLGPGNPDAQIRDSKDYLYNSRGWL